MSLTGEPGRPPVRMGLPMGDLAGGMFGAFAVAGALLRREREGRGASIDLALLDCQVSLLTYIAQYYWTDGKALGPAGSGHTSVMPYGAYATDDGHLIIAVFNDRFWEGFCRAMERAEWASDPRFAKNRDRIAHRAELDPLIVDAFVTRPTAEWLERLHRHGVPAAPIQRVDQVLADEQVRYREMVTELDHPVHGRVPTIGTPIKIDGEMKLSVAPPARLGADTDDVLRDVAGYGADHIAALRRGGAIR
jgi:formyl-CoA transferase/CoA:oxalate CoA-transferase